MTAKLLAIFSVILAFRGSYLQKKAETKEQVSYSTTVSGMALLLAIVAYCIKEG